LFHSGNTAAETMPDTEARILTEGARYTGVINSTSPEHSMLIIDDRSFVLDHVVRFNGASWSREQAIQRLQAGTRVEIVVGPMADHDGDARLVESLEVLN